MALSTLEKVGLGAIAFFALKMLGSVSSAKGDESDERRTGLLQLEKVAAYKTTAHPQDVKAAFYNQWTDMFGENPSAGTLGMLLAHSALETGHWKDMWNWNPGNITVASGKYYVNPAPGQEKYKYAAWDSLEQGCREMIAYLQRKHPAAFAVLKRGFAIPEDVALYPALLKEGGYFEAPLDKYTETLTSVFRRYREPLRE